MHNRLTFRCVNQHIGEPGNIGVAQSMPIYYHSTQHQTKHLDNPPANLRNPSHLEYEMPLSLRVPTRSIQMLRAKPPNQSVVIGGRRL